MKYFKPEGNKRYRRAMELEHWIQQQKKKPKIKQRLSAWGQPCTWSRNDVYWFYVVGLLLTFLTALPVWVCYAVLGLVTLYDILIHNAIGRVLGLEKVDD